MKKRLLALALCGMLPLSGCAAMLERSHETITTHVDYAVTDDDSILRAESYQGLVSAMLYFVNEHRRGGTIRLYNYTGDVEADLANARDEVMFEDPLGAFSVYGFTYDFTRILTYYEVELRITYSRTAQQVSSLPEVTGLAGVRQELARMVREQKTSTVFLSSYFSGDGEMVRELLYLACMSAPELAAHHDWNYWPVSVTLYPETGTRRIIEVGLPQLTADRIEAEKQYAQELETAAAAILEANPPAGEAYTVEELAAIVRAAHGGYDPYGTDAALGALTGEPVEVRGAVLAMEYLCQQCGIETEFVSGTGVEWLIVAAPGGWRHLMSAMLFGPEEGVEWKGIPAEPFRLFTDQELLELDGGYEWDMALYPACVDEDIQALSLNGQQAGSALAEE